MPRVFALSCHAEYRCAHSGACCTAGWAIPVESGKQARLGGAVLVPGTDGTCRYFDRATRLCAVQRDHGEPALPDSCRHFPRVTLIDDRGIHVTLSHFCPTAAHLLFSDAPLQIVEGPRAFPATREYDGLNARAAWPPLVREALLFDPGSYVAWERFVVASLSAGSSRKALARIADAAETLRCWTPANGAMEDLVARFHPGAPAHDGSLDRYASIEDEAPVIVRQAIPADLRPADGLHPPTEPEPVNERVLARYLAAKAFATWTAYQGHGVRTLVAELVVARALVLSLAVTRSLFEAIREADRRLVHLVDRQSLVAALGSVERS